VEPAVAYPESRSIVQYLLETQGYAALGRWLDATAAGAGWRAAMEAAFGQGPDTLEPAWRAWLPRYLDGGWRQHALYAPDLGAVDELLSHGDYGGAAALLSALAAAPVPVAEAPRRAEQAERARAGVAAAEALSAGEAALAAGDYDHALTAGRSAAAGFTAARDAPRAAAADELVRRGQIGRDAALALDHSAALPAWRAVEARALAAQAAAGFQQLGNESNALRARSVARDVDQRLRPAGAALVVLAVVLLGWNLRRRRSDRATAWA
jgi:hypothetical protein